MEKKVSKNPFQWAFLRKNPFKLAFLRKAIVLNRIYAEIVV